MDLTKTNSGLKNIVVCLGWDTNKYDGGQAFDLDASVFLLGKEGKTQSEQDFVFYNNTHGGQDSVIHIGDNRTGAGEGDDEQVKIDLSKVPGNIEKIAFIITIHEAAERKQNFGQVSNAFVRIFNAADNNELVCYDLGEDFSVETAIIVAELYRYRDTAVNGNSTQSAAGSKVGWLRYVRTLDLMYELKSTVKGVES